jgi:hypothetical protein
MGELYRFELSPFIEKYGLKIYFETGTGMGISLRHALKSSFEEYFSVDVDPELIEKLMPLKKENKNLVLIRGFSKDALQQFAPKISQDKPVLWFLDAHFPGADFHKCSYEQSIRHFKKDAFPLEEEIDIICKLRDTSQDVFILDDFVLYEKGNYAAPEWKYEWLQEELDLKTNSSFIYETFNKTHNFKKDLRDQGYLVIIPKGIEDEPKI